MEAACSGAKNINIVYIKVPKTASSTSAGVTRQIADHHNLSGVSNVREWIAVLGEPGVWTDHGALNRDDYGINPTLEAVAPKEELFPSMAAINALELPVFIWTTLREPAARAMSSYYYQNETRRGFNTSKVEWLTDYNRGGNNQFRYIRSSAHDTLDDVFKTYDFIALTERFDESMVVLAAMLNVSLSEMLYAGETKKGNHLSQNEEPSDVRRILNNEFRQANYLDYELYRQANVALDAKIVEMQLETPIKQYKQLLFEAQRRCKLSCSEGDDGCCYVKDMGCGHQCLDRYSHLGFAFSPWCRES